MPRREQLDSAILEAALAGLESQRQGIDQQIAKVRVMLGFERSTGSAGRAGQPRRRISVAGRRRIAEAQKKRWAQLRQTKAEETKPKRRLSAAGRKRIAEAARKRWAEVKAKKEARGAALKGLPKTAKRAAKGAAPRKAAPKKESAVAPVEVAQG